jgi:hypothetical protein
MRDVPGSMAYYGAYEIIRNKFATDGQLSPGVTVIAGGMAGVRFLFSKFFWSLNCLFYSLFFLLKSLLLSSLSSSN